MNDDFSNLEAELKLLRPRRPSEQLRERLGEFLTAETRSAQRGSSKGRRMGEPSLLAFLRRLWRSLLWSSLATAAVIAMVIVLRQSRSDPKPTASSVAANSVPAKQLPGPVGQPRFKPIAAERVIFSSQREGLVTLSDGTVAQRVRQLSVDTYTWQDPKTKASLSWSIPREDLRIVPASFH